MNGVRHILTWVAKAGTLSLYALTLLAGYCGFINPARWVLPSMLGLIFPAFAIATVAVSVVWNVVRSRRMAIISDVVVLACVYPFLQICAFSFPKDASPEARTIKVMSYNIFNAKDNEYDSLPYNRTLSSLINSNADIICLQEFGKFDLLKRYARGCESQFDSLRSIYPYRAEEGRTDCGILSKFPVKDVTPYTPNKRQKHNYCECRLSVYGEELTIIVVHLPSYRLNPEERGVVENLNEGLRGMKRSAAEMKHSVYRKMKTAFLRRAKEALFIKRKAEEAEGNVIVCGDFNDVPLSWAYRCIRSAGLKDAFRDASVGWTYTYNSNHLLFHIDQMLYRGNLRPVKFEKGKVRSSDHFPIMAEFELTKRLFNNKCQN